MIVSFENDGTEAVFNGRRTPATRRSCPEAVWKTARRKLDLLDSVSSLLELRVPPGNRLEALVGSRAGQYSIRINQKYRLCFVWTESGPSDVEIVDYH